MMEQENDTVPFQPFSRQSEVIFSKRSLPHWEQKGGCYFITFRLGDSLPQHLLSELRLRKGLWLNQHPQPWNLEEEKEYGQLFTKSEEDWLDAGYGDCHLRNPDIRKLITDSLSKFDGQRYELDCYVLMPNHVHIIWQMKDKFMMKKELQSLKGATGNACNKLLQRSGAFWMGESYDRLIRDKEELFAFRNYIESNPKKADLSNHEFSLQMNQRLTCY